MVGRWERGGAVEVVTFRGLALATVTVSLVVLRTLKVGTVVSLLVMVWTLAVAPGIGSFLVTLWSVTVAAVA